MLNARAVVSVAQAAPRLSPQCPAISVTSTVTKITSVKTGSLLQLVVCIVTLAATVAAAPTL